MYGLLLNLNFRLNYNEILPANIVEGYSNMLQTKIVESNHTNKYNREWQNLKVNLFKILCWDTFSSFTINKVSFSKSNPVKKIFNFYRYAAKTKLYKSLL